MDGFLLGFGMDIIGTVGMRSGEVGDLLGIEESVEDVVVVVGEVVFVAVVAMVSIEAFARVGD